MKRALFDLVLIGAVLYAPWWLTLIFAATGIFYFPSFYEVIVAGLLVDLLYGVVGGVYAGYGIAGFIAGFIIFLVLERVKHELR